MPGYELIGSEEQAAVDRIFQEGGVLFAHGFHARRQGIYHVREFEAAFAEKFHVAHAQAVSSGTAALKVALKAVGVKPGDEVITQALNFIATVEAILDVGAVPIITNVDSSLNMDATELKAKISAKTKAIIPVHMLGFAANIKSICQVAQEYNIPVIEDNCESIGATFNGDFLGTIGDIGVFSFDFGKAITTGEGGMIVTNDSKYAKYVREYQDHGHENNPNLPRGKDTRTIYGFNYRMTELQGAIGKVQLGKLDYIIQENKARYLALENSLGDSVQTRTLFSECSPLYDTFMFYIDNPSVQEKVIHYLHQSGVGTKNIPDAVEWHFAGYWNHALASEQIANLKPSADLLAKYVAVPINLSRSVKNYSRIGEQLCELVKR